jgi:hypothetical protein
MFAGCATIEKIVTPAAQPFIQAAVDAAVASAVQKGVPALEIKSIAAQVLAVDTGSSVALSEVESIINGKLVGLNLSPADLAAAEILTATMEAVIETQLTGATAISVSAQTQVAVAELMNDIIMATSAYGV